MRQFDSIWFARLRTFAYESTKLANLSSDTFWAMLVCPLPMPIKRDRQGARPETETRACVDMVRQCYSKIVRRDPLPSRWRSRPVDGLGVVLKAQSLLMLDRDVAIATWRTPARRRAKLQGRNTVFCAQALYTAHCKRSKRTMARLFQTRVSKITLIGQRASASAWSRGIVQEAAHFPADRSRTGLDVYDCSTPV